MSGAPSIMATGTVPGVDEEPLRALFVLQGAHRVARGAEAAFEAIAEELARLGQTVTVIGGGPPRDDRSYRYVQVPHRPRERFEAHPTFPPLRSDIHWEQLAFAAKLGPVYRPGDHDVTLSCDFPFVNWRLRAGRSAGPAHVYVTENGDWPAHSSRSEFRFFACDGLVCTNPTYLARNQDRYRCTLIPNGVDPTRFSPGEGDRARFGLPGDRPVALMVSALVPYKRVLDGIEVVAATPDVTLVVAGDGPQRDAVDELAARRLPGRFLRLTVGSEDMPTLYRSADVVVHLATDEPFGNVYIEALACGVPVVAVANESTRWIIGDDGFLVDTDEHKAYAGALATALAEAPEASSGRAERCRARFGWSVVGAQYLDFLRHVVGRR